MDITFLAHSAFLVELDTCSLLFDWTGETPLPPLDPSKHLYVFASHHHGDHFTPKIFRLGMEGVTYILASCIRLSAKRKALFAIDDRCVHRLRAGVTEKIGALTVRTMRSTDAGVAFLVQAEGKTLFHAGDLNHWHWEGEPDPWNPNMERDFKQALAQLQGEVVDAAFLPLDGRLEHAFWWGFHGFMEAMEIAAAFPMHCWEDFSVIPRLLALPDTACYRSRVVALKENGQKVYL